MAVTIAGRQFWLWRAVDDEGEVLDLLVQRRRDKATAVNPRLASSISIKNARSAPIVKSSTKPKATNKDTPGRSRRVPTNRSNAAQDVATPPRVPIITAASSTWDLRRR
jgi:hypothetical protein